MIHTSKTIRPITNRTSHNIYITCVVMTTNFLPLSIQHTASPLTCKKWALSSDCSNRLISSSRLLSSSRSFSSSSMSLSALVTVARSLASSLARTYRTKTGDFLQCLTEPQRSHIALNIQLLRAATAANIGNVGAYASISSSSPPPWFSPGTAPYQQTELRCLPEQHMLTPKIHAHGTEMRRISSKTEHLHKGGLKQKMESSGKLHDSLMGTLKQPYHLLTLCFKMKPVGFAVKNKGKSGNARKSSFSGGHMSLPQWASQSSLLC